MTTAATHTKPRAISIGPSSITATPFGSTPPARRTSGIAANAYHEEGDDEHAIADYSDVIRLNPKFANAYDCRAKSYTARGDLDRAIADYGEAITINRKNAWAYSNRSRIYLYTGDLARRSPTATRQSSLIRRIHISRYGWILLLSATSSQAALHREWRRST